MEKQQLTLEEKQAIREALVAYIATYPSQTKAATSLKGTSVGTVNSIANGKFDNVSDAMFLRIRSQVGLEAETTGWKICETTAYKDMDTFLEDAQRNHNVLWVVAPAGIGKSTAARLYAQSHSGVYLLPCSEDMHKADFVGELARKIGIRTEGLTVRETLMGITRELVKSRRPLLIFDEGDKLTDSVMYYFISLYNALEDRCGIVFLSTRHIEKRMARGLQADRKGYEELYSRIGRRFVPLTSVDEGEVCAICRANGLTDESAVRKVVADSATTDRGRTEYDLRRVRKSTLRQLKIEAARRM